MRVHSMIIVALALAPSRAAAYPISPVHLWQLIDEADVVVLADVESVALGGQGERGNMRDAPSATTVRTTELGPSIARLRVRDTWKGAAPSSIEVPFNSGMICPAPPRFVARDTVVVFLAHAGEAWSVIALSYGVRRVAPADIAPTRERIREAVALHAGGSVGRGNRIAWLVACCEHPATRGDAFRELAPRIDWFDQAYDRVQRPDDLAASLDVEQRRRIVAAVVARPPIIQEVPMVAHVFRDYPSDELTRILVQAVEDALGEKDNRYILPDAMIAVGMRLDVPRVGARFDSLDIDFERPDYYPPLEDYRRAWDAALAETRGVGVGALE